MYVYIRHK